MSGESLPLYYRVEDHEKATLGLECRKDEDVIDETSGADKPIDAVIDAQQDLVDIVYTLKQVVCGKGEVIVREPPLPSRG